MKRPTSTKRRRRTTASRQTRRRRAGQGRLGRVSSAGVTQVSRAGGNVFADLGYSPRLAENLQLRSDLMSEAVRLIEGMTQVQAATLLGVSQPRISELKRGHIERFTVDALVNMLGEAGVRVRISLSRRRRRAA